MRISIFLDGKDVTANVLPTSTKLSCDLNGRRSQCSFTLRVDGDIAAGYDTIGFDGSAYRASYLNAEDVLITDWDNKPIFRGTVASVKLSQKRRSPEPVDFWELTCDDQSIALDKIIVPNQVWTNVSDQSIVTGLITSLLPGIDTSNIKNLVTVKSFEAKDATLTKVLTDIAALSAAEFWLTPDNKFWFTTEDQAPVCPVVITDDQTNQSGIRAPITSVNSNKQEYANRVVVYGAVSDIDGNSIRAQADDLAEQTAKGRIEVYTLIDRETITTTEDAQVVANSELTRRTAPQQSISFYTFEDAGLDLGQVISIDAACFGLNDTFLINSISLSWETSEITRYECQCGTFRRSFADVLAQLKRAAQGSTGAQIGVVPDNSITDVKVSDISVSKIEGDWDVDRIDGNWKVENIDGNWNVSRIDGNWPVARISGNWNVANIDGNWTVDRIDGDWNVSRISGNWNVDRLDGTISATQIGVLNIGNFADGTITSDKLDYVNISKIVVDGVWASGDITLGGGSFFCDTGSIQATTGALRSQHFHHTGGSVTLDNPSTWRSSLGVPSLTVTDGLNSRLTTAEADIGTLQSQVSTLQTQVADLISRVEALEGA